MCNSSSNPIKNINHIMCDDEFDVKLLIKNSDSIYVIPGCSSFTKGITPYELCSPFFLSHPNVAFTLYDAFIFLLIVSIRI